MLATVVSRIGAFTAQASPPVTAGLISGAIVGAAAIVAGLVHFGAPTARTIALLACPESDRVVARAPAGQPLLAIARSADAGWVEVYVGEPGVEGAWTRASAVRLQDAADKLPVASCVQTAVAPASASPLGTVAPPAWPTDTLLPTIAASLAPDVTPGASVSTTLAPGATATPRASAPASTAKPTAPPITPPPVTQPPTPTPTPAPTPVPPPDFTAPTLSNLNTSNSCIGPDVPSSTISITATDPDDPISLMRITTYPPGGLSIPDGMTWVGGNVWQYTVNWSSNWTAGYYDFTIRARDTHFNQSDPVSSDHNIGGQYIRVAPIGCIIK